MTLVQTELKSMKIWRPSGLPSEYQEVEYIQSSGTQYFVLGTQFDTGNKVVVDFQMTATGGDQVIVGMRDNSNHRFAIDAWNGYFKIAGGGLSRTDTIQEDTNRHTIIINKGIATVDGNSYNVDYVSNVFNYGIGVLFYNYPQSSEACSSNKLYKLDIYDSNGTHIYDLVPCYRISDSVIGMYDLVNNTFYTNSGTGTFTKGNDVNLVQKEIKRVTIRPNGTEKQIRPVGWQPGVNTIIYYSFDNTLNDGSGNYNLTNSGTTFTTLASGKKVLSVEQASATYTGGPNLVGKSITLSFWMADTAARTGFSDWPYFSLVNNIVWVNHSGPSQSNKIYAGVQGNINYNSAPTYNDTNTWHHVVITFDNSTRQLKEYIDNSLKATNTLSSAITGTISQIKIGGTGYAGEVHFMMSECILEDKIWTDQEISDYYNLTKGNYGL